MKYIQLFFLLFVQLGFGQEPIIIDDQFNSKSIKNELSYYLDVLETESVSSIKSKDFESFTKFFPGLVNTRFWFRLTIENSKNVPINLIYKINTVSFEDLIVYVKNEGNLKEIYRFDEKMNKNIDIPIQLDSGLTKEYYFKVDFTKSIYLPFKLVSKEENIGLSTKRQIQLSFYYGFTLMVLLINVFFFINTKDKFFLFYCFLLLSITFILAELDGLFYLLLGNSNLIRHVDITLHLCLIISLMLFTTNALRLNNYYPKLNSIGVSIILANLFCFVIYVITDNLLWYSIGEGLNAIGLLMYWLSGFFLLKKEVYARYIVLGYSIIFISSNLYVLPSEFGLIDVGFTTGYFKIGSVVEMLVFIYAISYRHKVVEKKNNNIEISYTESLKNIKYLEKEVVSHQKKLKLKKEEYLIEFKKKYDLSTREIEVLSFLVFGNTNKQIAEKLFLSESSIKQYCAKLFDKTNVKNRVQLVALFNRLG